MPYPNTAQSAPSSTWTFRPEVVVLTKSITAQANKQMMIGLLMIVIGASVSLWTYENAKPGGSFVILWGLVVVGLIRCGRALRRRQRAFATALEFYATH